MDKLIITLTETNINDISQGLLIAMKELDKYEKGRDRILSDRLEVLLKDIDMQVSQTQNRRISALQATV